MVYLEELYEYEGKDLELGLGLWFRNISNYS